MIAAAGGLLLPAEEVAFAQPMGDQKPKSRGSQSTSRPGVYAVQPAFTQLKFGEIKPTGWILAQMRRDLQTGFAGHLDELCPEASSDIFASGRNSPGKPNKGNAASDAWWNGETEGNWRCGHTMLACLTQDPAAMAKAQTYVNHILASQDADGYIGIFSPELRYNGNGEFWTQTCLFRGLLAYAEAAGDVNVYKAVKRAVDRTMEGYSGKKDIQFAQHDAMYTDVLEPLYAKTGDKRYLDFGLQIYRERANLLQFHQQPLVGHTFQNCYEGGHGATVTESMRMPFWFWTATGDEEYLKLGMGVVSAMNGFTMPSGALVSEESVDAPPQPGNAGYEYCTIFERQFSLISASYWVWLWRTAAPTAKVSACSSRFRPASERPMRPLARTAVCSAMAATSVAGQPGNSSAISLIICATSLRSCSIRCAAARARVAARSTVSCTHSCSAFSSAVSSTRMPCRS
jgi:hypothetical protein